MTDHKSDLSAPFLAILPLKNIVILPKSITPIIVGRQSSIRAVEYSLKHQKPLFITAQRNSEIENPSLEDIFTIGSRANIVQVMRMPKGTLKLVVEGISRSSIVQFESGEGFMGAYCEDVPTTNNSLTSELEALWRYLQSLYNTYAQLNPKAPSDLLGSARTSEEMDIFADTLTIHLQLSFLERQDLLETNDLKKRLFKAL